MGVITSLQIRNIIETLSLRTRKLKRPHGYNILKCSFIKDCTVTCCFNSLFIFHIYRPQFGQEMFKKKVPSFFIIYGTVKNWTVMAIIKEIEMIHRLFLVIAIYYQASSSQFNESLNLPRFTTVKCMIMESHGINQIIFF